MSPRLTLLLGLAAATVVGRAKAEPRLDVTVTICEAGASEIERRTASIIDEESSGLRASVTFEEAGEGVRVSVRTRANSVPRGETVLIVPTCEEAVDAAVVVLSLALGAETTGDTPVDKLEPEQDPRLQSVPPHATGADSVVRLGASRPRRDELPASDAARHASGSTQLSLAGGVDMGTLPTPAVFVAGGVTHAWSHVEVRSSLRYGLLTQDERVETGFSESVQRDFGAGALSVCYGLGANFRVSACTGGEVGVVRVGRRLEVDGVPTRDQDELSPRLSGLLGAIFSAPRGRLRPELELSGTVLALGRREGAAPVALRAAAGAAIDF